MRRLGVAWVAVAVGFVTSGTAAGPAVAAAKKLDLNYGNPVIRQVQPGDDVIWEYTENIKFATHPDTVECPGDSGSESKDLTNVAPTDTLELGPSFGSTDLAEGKCTSDDSLGHMPSVGFFLNDEVFSLSTKGKAQIKGTKENPGLLVISYAPEIACLYTATKLSGSVKFVSFEGEKDAVLVAFTNQKLKFDKAQSSPLCPSDVTVTATYLGRDEGALLIGSLVT